MKNWVSPDIEVFGVDETQYGGKPSEHFDGVYVHAESGRQFLGYLASGQEEFVIPQK